MRPLSMGVTTLAHGLFTSMVLLVLADVASPTFNVEEIPAWTGGQAVAVFVTVLTVSFALGIVMHTISRGLFHKQKQRWTMDVLASGAVEHRLADLGGVYPAPGGPTYAELWDEERDTRDRPWRASMFMHGVEYQIMVRAPHVFETIQAYRDQYRVARGFILPLAVLAFMLPFWAPVAALDGAGSIGPFPIIRSQVFMVSILASAVTFQAFRERAYRYVAATTLAWVTMEGIDMREHDAPLHTSHRPRPTRRTDAGVRSIESHRLENRPIGRDVDPKPGP